MDLAASLGLTAAVAPMAFALWEMFANPPTMQFALHRTAAEIAELSRKRIFWHPID